VSKIAAIQFLFCFSRFLNDAIQPVRSAYQPPASSTFLSEQTSHQQSANSTFLSQQISTSHQPPAKRTGCISCAVELSFLISDVLLGGTKKSIIFEGGEMVKNLLY
jgi:hypothetical protein